MEGPTGRTVRPFISGIEPIADVSIETFILWPAGSKSQSRGRIRG